MDISDQKMMEMVDDRLHEYFRGKKSMTRENIGPMKIFEPKTCRNWNYIRAKEFRYNVSVLSTCFITSIWGDHDSSTFCEFCRILQKKILIVLYVTLKMVKTPKLRVLVVVIYFLSINTSIHIQNIFTYIQYSNKNKFNKTNKKENNVNEKKHAWHLEIL